MVDQSETGRPRPSVSVVIPTYNRAVLLARCLDSLLRGGIPDVEIIVVDDGGNDDSEAVTTSRGATYIRQKNAGPAEARNNGFRNSRGRYLTFIDSDDEWVNGNAARLLAQAETNPRIDVVFADATMGNDEDGWVSFVGTYGGQAFEQLPVDADAGGARILRRDPLFLQLSTRNVMFLGSMLIRREFFDGIGQFDPTLRGAADWDFFMRATALGTVAYSPGPPVSKYYKHSEGMSTDNDHMQEEFIRALDSVRRRVNLPGPARQHVESEIRAQVFGWAWRAYERADYPLARTRLKLASSLGQFRTREALYLAATYLPGPVLRALRRAKQTIAPADR